MRILVTGASGVLGREIVPLLEAAGAELVLLRRKGERGSGEVSGDIERDDLGLVKPRELLESVNAIVHCAARTDFGIDPVTARRVNVDGTENVLRFASRCGKLDRIVLLSTVYVAGRRSGVIRSDELDHDAGFVNEYEHSKYQMEQRALRWRTELPVAVVRTSTIIGHSSGRVDRFDAIHRALELYFRGLVPMIPGENDAPVDLVSSDAAAEAIVSFLLHRFEPRTVQFAAGEAALPLDALLDLVHRTFDQSDGAWHARGVEKPPVVSLAAFSALEESVRVSGDLFFTDVLRSMRQFVPQLAYPKQFVSDFPPLTTAEQKETIRRVLGFCVREDFGRRRRREA